MEGIALRRHKRQMLITQSWEHWLKKFMVEITKEQFDKLKAVHVTKLYHHGNAMHQGERYHWWGYCWRGDAGMPPWSLYHRYSTDKYYIKKNIWRPRAVKGILKTIKIKSS